MDLGCPPWGKGLISSLMLWGNGKTLRGALGLFSTPGVCLGKGLWDSGFTHAVSLPGMDYEPVFCSVLPDVTILLTTGPNATGQWLTD